LLLLLALMLLALFMQFSLSCNCNKNVNFMQICCFFCATAAKHFHYAKTYATPHWPLRVGQSLIGALPAVAAGLSGPS